MTEGPSGTFPCVCGFHLVPVARAAAIESRENWIVFPGYRSRATTACPGYLETLRRGVSLKEMLGARQGCPEFIVLLHPARLFSLLGTFGRVQHVSTYLATGQTSIWSPQEDNETAA